MSASCEGPRLGSSDSNPEPKARIQTIAELEAELAVAVYLLIEGILEFVLAFQARPAPARMAGGQGRTLEPVAQCYLPCTVTCCWRSAWCRVSRRRLR